MKIRVLSISLFLLCCSCSPTSSSHSALPPSNFHAAALDGRPASLAQFRGHPVLVTFLASWCMTCLDDLLVLETVWNRHEEDGLIVIGVAIDDTIDEARRKVERAKLTFPILVDTTGEAKKKFDVTWLPTTVLIDADGHAMTFPDPNTGEQALSISGPRPWANGVFDQFVKDKLAE